MKKEVLVCVIFLLIWFGRRSTMVVSTPAVFNNSVQIFGSNTLSTSSLQIVGGGQGEYYTLNADKVKDFITELRFRRGKNE